MCRRMISQVAHPAGARRLDELHALQAQGLATDDARHVQPVDRPDGDEDQHDVAAEDHHQQDHEKHERQGVDDVHDAHHDAVRGAAVETRRWPRR